MKHKSIEIFGYSRGFTLLEVILSMAILIIMSGVLVTIFRDVFQTNELLKSSFFIEREIAETARDMIAEIRAAGTSSTGGYLIEQADPFSIVIYTNVDKDPVKERVAYFVSGTDLKKSVVDPTGSPLTYATTTASESVKTVLAHFVASTTAPLFQYFDKNYAGTTTPLTVPVNVLSIRHIRILLVVDENVNDTIPPFTVGSEVSIRNLKYVQ